MFLSCQSDIEEDYLQPILYIFFFVLISSNPRAGFVTNFPKDFNFYNSYNYHHLKSALENRNRTEELCSQQKQFIIDFLHFYIQGVFARNKKSLRQAVGGVRFRRRSKPLWTAPIKKLFRQKLQRLISKILVICNQTSIIHIYVVLNFLRFQFI